MRYLFLCLFLLPWFAYSQHSQTENPWNLTVLNAQTGMPVAGATMTIAGKKHFVGNSEGQITVDKKQISLNDTLKISSIGFQSRTIIAVKNFPFPNSIKLLPGNEMLSEVLVTPKQQIKLGDVKRRYNTHPRAHPDEIMAQYIPNDKGISGTITTIEYFVNDSALGIERPFKVGLYTKGKYDVFPDQNLLNDSLVVFNPTRKKKIVVDVSKYNIQFPKEGVIAVFETLCPEAYGSDRYWDFGQLHSKVPALDMDLKSKGNFSADTAKYNRTIPYALVMDTTSDNRFTPEDVRRQAYIYTEGNNFAIVITIEQ